MSVSSVPGSTLRVKYPRYWGAIEHHPVLHFETCYYQVIEYCISRGLATFEGGAQGERTKLARGLLPVQTTSAHWIARREFASAIENFLARETQGIAHHLDELNERAPFKASHGEAGAVNASEGNQGFPPRPPFLS